MAMQDRASTLGAPEGMSRGDAPQPKASMQTAPAERQPRKHIPVPLCAAVRPTSARSTFARADRRYSGFHVGPPLRQMIPSALPRMRLRATQPKKRPSRPTLARRYQGGSAKYVSASPCGVALDRAWMKLRCGSDGSRS